MNQLVLEQLQDYPEAARQRLAELRALIYALAYELDCVPVVESLKWGEPSYVAPEGSAIRMDWKARQPEQVCLYFNCNTKLVATFRELYGEVLNFAGNRAIELPLAEPLPEPELRHCLALALQYKRLRHLPMLGA